jgi:hypothetical protein
LNLNLKRVASNAEERADMKALQDDPPYNPEKNVKRGSAHRNKRPAAPGEIFQNPVKQVLLANLWL